LHFAASRVSRRDEGVAVKTVQGRTGRLASRWARVGGRELHYRASIGPDPGGGNVVLVPGMTSGLAMVPFGEHLAAHFRVYVPDLPGIGPSHRPAEPLDLAGHVEVLGELIRMLRLDRAHLIGNSFGCNIAIEAAIRHPDLVGTITLQGLIFAPSLRTPLRAAPAWLLNTWREMPKPSVMRQSQREVPPREAVAMMREALRHEVEERLPLVPCPTLLVRGTEDPMFPPEWLRQALQSLRYGRSCEIAGATHSIMVLAPASFAAAVRGFIQASQRAAVSGAAV
jgi:2-hydroxy-6-oxonona-2,4-dienedioate hydrolase